MSREIEIGVRFTMQLAKGKTCECEVEDIIKRVSTKTGDVISFEYWAKSESFGLGLSFEVSKNTILRGIINV